jgi:hypothetical protein
MLSKCKALYKNIKVGLNKPLSTDLFMTLKKAKTNSDSANENENLPEKVELPQEPPRIDEIRDPVQVAFENIAEKRYVTVDDSNNLQEFLNDDQKIAFLSVLRTLDFANSYWSNNRLLLEYAKALEVGTVITSEEFIAKIKPVILA